MRPRLFTHLGCALAILAASTAPLASAAVADAAANASAALRDFIDAASYRLSLADQVALTKWDSRKPIEDQPREKVVIEAAVAAAAAQGLPAPRVSAVFTDQIEANKLVQYRLLAQWRRAAAAPATARPNLVLDIRPQLDKLQIRLIDDLVHTGALTAQSDCASQVAMAVGDYASARQLDALHALALDRAVARFCEK